MRDSSSFGRRTSAPRAPGQKKLSFEQFLYATAILMGGIVLKGWLFGTPAPQAATKPAETPAPKQSTEVAAVAPVIPVAAPRSTGCGPDGRGSVQDSKFGVKQKARLRTSPLADATDVVNEKATAVLGRTYYHEIEYSETLQETCRYGAWSLIAIVEPTWLADVKGWVPTDALRAFETVSDKRMFVESDIYWDSYVSRYDRQKVIRAINRVVLTRKECPSFDPGVMSVASGRGSPSNPVFFITCMMPNMGAYNVFFDLDGNVV